MSESDPRGGAGSPSPTVAECVEAGLYFFARDEFTQAKKWWEQALAKDPENARVHECLRILHRTVPRPKTEPPSPAPPIRAPSSLPDFEARLARETRSLPPSADYAPEDDYRPDSIDIAISEPPELHVQVDSTPPTPLPVITNWGIGEPTYTPRQSAIPPPRAPPPALDEWSVPSRPPAPPALLEEWSRPSLLPGSPPVRAPLSKSSAPAAPDTAGPWNPGAQLEIDGGMSIDPPMDELLGTPPADPMLQGGPAFSADVSPFSMDVTPYGSPGMPVIGAVPDGLDADWDAAMRPFLSADVAGPLRQAQLSRSADLVRPLDPLVPLAPLGSLGPLPIPEVATPVIGPPGGAIPGLDVFAVRPPIIRGTVEADEIIRPADQLPTEVGRPFQPTDVAPEDIILPSNNSLSAVQRFGSSPPLTEAAEAPPISSAFRVSVGSSPGLGELSSSAGAIASPSASGPVVAGAIALLNALPDADDGLPPARTFATGSLSPRGAIKDEPSPEELMGEGTLGRGDPLDIVIEEPEEYVDRDQVLRAFGEGAEYSLGAFADISDDEVDPLAPGETTPWDFGPAETSAVTLAEAADVDAVAELTPAPVLDREPLFHLSSSGDVDSYEPAVEISLEDDPRPSFQAELEKRALRPRTSDPDDPRALLISARDRLNLHDFDGALVLLERISPEAAAAAPEAQDMLAETRARLEQIYGGKLGSLEAAPHVLLSGEELIWLNLNHRAGFILSQVDGAVSYEDLISLSGMPRLDTLRILCTLLQEGVIGTD